MARAVTSFFSLLFSVDHKMSSQLQEKEFLKSVSPLGAAAVTGCKSSQFVRTKGEGEEQEGSQFSVV